MKTSPDERSYTGGGWDAETLVLPPQSCRRRSLPRLPEFHLNSMHSSTDIKPKSPITVETQNHGLPTSQNLQNMNKNCQERRGSHLNNLGSNHNGQDHSQGQNYRQQNPHRPPRPSLQLQLQSSEFADQFDAFLYQSQHIATPSHAPEVMLEIPSEESSRRPSNCSGISSSSPFVPNNQPPANFLFPTQPDKTLQRRNSHAGNLGNTIQQQHVSPAPAQQAFLNVPRSRSRGSSLPDTINSAELYRLRNFATSGKRVINKGDSYRSRNSSINSSRSR
jgi:hypothetical protein